MGDAFEVVAIVAILTLFWANLVFTFRWWHVYRDLRAVRGVAGGIALFTGAVALAVAAIALREGDPRAVVEVLHILVHLMEGVLAMVGLALVWSYYREGRAP